MGWHFASPYLRIRPVSVAFVPFLFSLRARSTFMRPIVFLVERCRTRSGSMIFGTRRRPVILRTHVVARLSTAIVTSIFAWHWPFEISVLRAIGLARIVLRASHLAVHCPIVHAIFHAMVRTIVNSAVCAIVHASIGAIVHPPVLGSPRRDHVTTVEFSRPRRGCDCWTAMVH